MGMTDGTVRKFVRRLALIGIFAIGLAACSATIRNHGYLPPEDELAQLTVGVDTRETVLALVGQPTSTGLLDTSALYYVQSKFRHYGAAAPQEIDRQVLAISFAENGTVANIERFGLERGQVVVLSRRVTSDNVRDTTLLRQLFGALGNFDAGSVIGEN